MRQPARSIWESASRPLFVRSVWLERIGETGRSHRRHFILDYEPRDRQRWIHSQRQSAKRVGASYQSESCQFVDKSMAIEDSVDYTLDEYLLLDATKLTLQRQQQVSQAQAAMANKVQATFSTLHSRRHAKRRAWLVSSGKSYQLDHHHLTDQHSHLHSRRSSLQDAHAGSTLTTNPEERLAERVINWLDLAGRADIVKVATPATPVTSSSASQRVSRQGHRGMGLKRCATGTVSQRETPRKTVTKQAVVNYCSNPSNAKPITIIFNKEGVPVRLNRPARNIDLCSLSTSASTTRRLAGQLASARLYNGTAGAAAAAPSATAVAPTLERTRTPPQSSRGLTAKQQECRKQLHIFMPSLPKKGLLVAATSSEDALSASFSDLYF
ncbi:GH15709 [Drosophila grimshawi]|uniref:GH15709 n=2 Tax=Drosophila grimshawi TaxID=7222 RepID=B4JUI8_DROGR|nr:GH15709 [Drosophila grimshawi]